MRWLYELDHVTFSDREGQPILDAVSFSLAPQTFVALVGPAGAGKTTLFKLMNRLVSPTRGGLSLEGEQLETIAVQQLRQRVMLVGQSSQLLGMTVREALHYPLALQKLPSLDRERQFNEVIDRLQIPQAWLEKTELQLSGGQQQQVAIARALVARPQLLLLDEPTSALDVGAASRILQVIQALIKEQMLTVLMSNHQLDLVQDFCDRVLYLEKGRLKLDEPAHQIDWSTLRQTFVETDAQARDEWGDADEVF